MSDGETILYLGAPTNDRLRQTWREEFLTLPVTHLNQQLSQVSWRHLTTIPHDNSNDDTVASTDRNTTDDSLISDADALDISYSLHLTGTIDAQLDHTSLSLTTDSGSSSSLLIDESTIIPTPQLPSFDFNMSTVLDLEDLQHVSTINNLGRPRLFSTLAAVLEISSPRSIVTKAGIHTQIVILTLGDVSSNGFELAVWGHHATIILESIRRLDIVLLQDFMLSKYQDTLSGTSRLGKTTFTVLYRVLRKSSADDILRPLLLDDLQSQRVRAIRDWVVTWVPSDTQPDHTQPDDTS